MTWSRAAALLLAASAVAGCTPLGSGGPEAGPPTPARAPSDPPLARFYEQQIDWDGCGNGFRCARVRVPVDYARPDGAETSLAVVRHPADGDRLGALLVNPGGPGVGGTGYARSLPVSPAVAKRYDVVGFDPRGVGDSDPVRCLTPRQTDRLTAYDGSPDDAAEEAGLLRLNRLFAHRCATRNGGLLAHVGTRDEARDLDVLRGVLGDDRLTFLGKSYGTYLGATYAELFPKRVGRLVLDGVVDPAADVDDLARAQALGFEQALASFVDDCLTRDDCPLAGDRAAALAQVSAIVDAADRTPLPGPRPVTQSLVLLGIAYAMYDPDLWRFLRSALAGAQRGDGRVLLALADAYLDRTADGRYPTNFTDAINAVLCLDRPEASDVAVLRARAAELAAIAPRFGAYTAWSTVACSVWPVPAEGEPGAVRAAGAAPILVVGTTRDPATPYAFARNLAGELASGRLLTYVGDGHTAYREGSRCIDAAVDAYLLTGRLPAEGTRCR